MFFKRNFSFKKVMDLETIVLLNKQALAVCETNPIQEIPDSGSGLVYSPEKSCFCSVVVFLIIFGVVYFTMEKLSPKLIMTETEGVQKVDRTKHILFSLAVSILTHFVVNCFTKF